MTREEKLWSMTMVNLVSVAEKLGVKIDKKGAKEKAIKKIIAAEDAKNAKTDNLVPMPGVEKLAELKKEVDEDTCADGRKYSEIGKEIAKEAKEKAKKVKSAKKSIEKKAKVTNEKKSFKVEGRKALIDVLEKNNKNYKLAGKRLRLLDSANKCFAYILFNNNSLRLYMNEEYDTYSQIAKIATNNKYEKSRYNKTIVVDYDKLETIVKLSADKKEEN